MRGIAMRLGKVLWWAGSVFAVLFAIRTLGTAFAPVPDAKAGLANTAIGLALWLACWLGCFIVAGSFWRPPKSRDP